MAHPRNPADPAFKRALSELRLTADGTLMERQAWLTRDEAIEILRRLDDQKCDTCGCVCRGEVVARYCDGCVTIEGK